MFTYGKYPIEAMPSFFKKADAMLLTLSGKYSDLELYIPARLQSYMAAGIPILAMINGASKDLVENANCGYAVNAGDYSSLSKIIKKNILTDQEAFKKLGLNGRNFFENNFQMDICINNLCKIINN
jgi:glycosyltransferase involved in cell wall biosynthesis